MSYPPPLRHRTLVVFDLDGTLLDTLQLIRSVLNELAQEFDFQTITPDRFERLRRMSVPQIIRDLGIRRRHIPEIARRTRAAVQSRHASASVFAGVEEALHRLIDEGFELGVLSSNHAQLAVDMLQPELLERLSFVDGDAGLLDKAARLEQIRVRTGRRHCELLYVGDELRDIEAAQAAGVGVLAVTWGANHSDTLADALPTALVHRPEQLLQRVQRHAGLLGRTDVPLQAAVRWSRVMQHLHAISRTFSKSIRVLSPLSRRSVALTYLLMRVLDCVEDHHSLPAGQRAELLTGLAADLRAHQLAPERVEALVACAESPAHERLLRDSIWLFAQLDALPSAHLDAALRAMTRMALGMAERLETQGDRVRFESDEQYARYVHCVSGVVGQFLTELFVESLELSPDVAESLFVNTAAFARALKATNDLQDAWVDAVQGQGSPIPNAFFRDVHSDVARLGDHRVAQVNREALKAFAETIERDLQQATRYLACIPKRHVRERTFLLLPLIQARETLRLFEAGVSGRALAGHPAAPSKRRVLQVALSRGPASLASNRYLARYLGPPRARVRAP